jgi:hypothetical protein
MFKFGWIATLHNGQKIYQRHPHSGEKFAYENLPWGSVACFELVDLATQRQVIKLDIAPNEKLSWRRRHTKAPGKPEQVIHIIAKKSDGKWKAIGVYEPDGRVEITNLPKGLV